MKGFKIEINVRMELVRRAIFFEKKTILLSRQIAVIINMKSSRGRADIVRHAPHSDSIKDNYFL